MKYEESPSCTQARNKVEVILRMNELPSRHTNAVSLIAELGSESSAHGLARIVSSKGNKRRLIWTLLVIIGLAAATVQFSMLVKKYLQFQVVEVSEVKDSMPVEFPAITVCNIEPISLRKVRKLLSLPDAALKKWLEFVYRFKFGKQSAHLSSIRAFYENLGDEAEYVRHELKDFMLHCRFNKETCGGSNFTTSFDGNYYSCFTFNRGNSDKILMHSTGPENGLSLIIAVDNDNPPLGTYGVYNIDSNILHSAGVRVVVHAPNTMPSPVNHGFDVPPGYSSSIGLKAVLHTRLSEPYGNCSNSILEGSENYNNTFFTCLQLCKQRKIIEKCGCKSSDLPELPSSHSVPFCGYIKNWREMVAHPDNYPPNVYLPKLICEEHVSHEMTTDRSYEVSCKCVQPCHETTFQKSVSLSYWPLEFYQLNILQLLYNGTIAQSQLDEAYTYLSNITEEESQKEDSTMDKGYSTKEKEQAERASKLIRQNLLRVNIYLEDLSVVEFRQMPAYDMADLFADIGGTMGLWMGISVLTIMELVELIIRLIMLLFYTETRQMPEKTTLPNGVIQQQQAERRQFIRHDGLESSV
ncbi:hypothetical protein SNE40_008796 [Patella caerulea]|uniref:Uncharacterized protein n=1 Tax=Patella caerulea TaxID=87958 RepID=A0AAN8JMV6_PATCE